MHHEFGSILNSSWSKEKKIRISNVQHVKTSQLVNKRLRWISAMGCHKGLCTKWGPGHLPFQIQQFCLAVSCPDAIQKKQFCEGPEQCSWSTWLSTKLARIQGKKIDFGILEPWRECIFNRESSRTDIFLLPSLAELETLLFWVGNLKCRECVLLN